MAQRVLLIAATTGYQLRQFEQAARNLGLDVVLATDRCHVLDDPWGDSALPVRFENPEEAAQALSALNPKPEAVVAVGDRPTLIASLTAMRLGIPFHPPDAVLACRDKFRVARMLSTSRLTGSELCAACPSTQRQKSPRARPPIPVS